MADNVLFVGDVAPSLPAVVKDGSGNIIDLTPYTGGGQKLVQLAFRQEYDTTNKFKATAVVVSAIAGTVRYDESAGDLAVTPGMYRGQWILINATGGTQHVPAGRFQLQKAF